MSDDLDELERRCKGRISVILSVNEVLALIERCKSAEREVKSLKLANEVMDGQYQAAMRQRDEAFKRGVKKGLWLFAWWKDGVEYVGTCGTTLKTALDMVDKGELP